MSEINEPMMRYVSDNLPSMVRDELAKLSVEKQRAFVEEYERKEKGIFTGYVLWLVGFHYVYIGKWGIFILFLITIGGLFIWWFIDFFRVYGMIRNYNKDIAMDIFKNMKAISQ